MLGGAAAPLAVGALAAGTMGTALPVVAAGLAGVRLARYLSGKGKRRKSGGADNGSGTGLRKRKLDLADAADTIARLAKRGPDGRTATIIPAARPQVGNIDRLDPGVQLRRRAEQMAAAARSAGAAARAKRVRAAMEEQAPPLSDILKSPSRAADKAAGKFAMKFADEINPTSIKKGAVAAFDWLQRNPTKAGLGLLAAATAGGVGYAAYEHLRPKRRRREESPPPRARVAPKYYPHPQYYLSK